MSISSPFNQNPDSTRYPMDILGTSKNVLRRYVPYGNLLSKEYARPRSHRRTMTIFRFFFGYIGTYTISPCVIDSIYIHRFYLAEINKSPCIFFSSSGKCACKSNDKLYLELSSRSNDRIDLAK